MLYLQFLNHVTGRCHHGFPAMVSTTQGITSKLYSPWLWAEHARDLKFMNPTEFETERSNLAARGRLLQKSIEYNSDRGYREKIEKPRCREAYEKDNPEKKIMLAMEMCHELQTLNLTLNRQSLGRVEEIQHALLHKVRLSNYDPQIITKLAADLVRKYASHKACEKDDAEGLIVSLLQFMGHGLSIFKRAYETRRDMEERAQKSCRKRASFNNLEIETKGLAWIIQKEAKSTATNKPFGARET